MPHHQVVTIAGRVTDIFAHRFVVEEPSGARTLVDLGPEGAKTAGVATGDEVSIEGERHPSEVKVTRLTRDGRATDIQRPPKHKPPHEDLDPAIALRTVEAEGAKVVGEPLRKPKHFEVLGSRNGEYTEYHVEADGRIRKAKPVQANDAKWASAIGRN